MLVNQNTNTISLRDYLAKFTFGQKFLVKGSLYDEDKYLIADKYILKKMLKGSQRHELLEDDAFKFNNSKDTYIVLPVEQIFTATIDYLSKFKDNQLFKVTETSNCINFLRTYYCKKESIKELSEHAFEARCSRNRKKLTLCLDNHEFEFKPVSSI